MKLSLTAEADAINVLALNMGRIIVDIDGIELEDIINAICDNGYSLRIADTPGKRVVEDPLLPAATLPVSIAVPRISPKPTTPCCTNSRISMKTLVSQNGSIFRAPAICSV
ncbi:Uncharacterised protein [Citrobacter amalonaticus]|nr:Uncharacterised protein [Citrobacter amalonaticus]